jgi:hypothetical protein
VSNIVPLFRPARRTIIVDWVPVSSGRATHIAYLPEYTILAVRMRDGTETGYPRASLADFHQATSGASINRLIRSRLEPRGHAALATALVGVDVATTDEMHYACTGCSHIDPGPVDGASNCGDCLIYFRTDDGQCPGCGVDEEDCDQLLDDDGGICPQCGDVTFMAAIECCHACGGLKAEGERCDACASVEVASA